MFYTKFNSFRMKLEIFMQLVKLFLSKRHILADSIKCKCGKKILNTLIIAFKDVKYNPSINTITESNFKQTSFRTISQKSTNFLKK